MQKSFLHIDWQLLFPVAVLLFISLITLFSINIIYFKTQLFFCIIALVLYLLCAQVQYTSLARFSFPFYIGSLVLFTLILVIGSESRGAIRWIQFLGFGIQFSEIYKPLLAICLASFLSTRFQRSFANVLVLFGLLLPVVFLIYRQPDLGSALIYTGAVLLTLMLYGYSLKWFGLGFVVVLGSFPLLWQFLHAYQRQRLLSFFHLTQDPLGISYNAIQSVIAVGSGMFLGKGLGLGTQSSLRFLPERQTDFIFATLSEELGFVGSLIVIIAFSFLLYRLFVIFQESDDLFAKVFIASTFSLFLIQFFVNIGMNIGILPIVGVTLPFVSAGGSSLLSNAIFLGFVSAMSARAKGRNVLEIT